LDITCYIYLSIHLPTYPSIHPSIYPSIHLHLSLYQARLVHVIGIIWVQLIMYDSIKQSLGLPATGH